VKYLFFGLILSTSVMAQEFTWTYSGENSGEMIVYDVSGQFGEEYIMWMRNGQRALVEISEVSMNGYGANHVVEDSAGDTLTDVSISIMLRGSYTSILPLLQDDAFRETFTELPNACAEKANGFLILSDNLNSEMRGYCLIPKN